MVEWKTISSKISEDVYGAMKMICDKENIAPNQFIRKAVEKAVHPVLSKEPGTSDFPGIGENKFEYDPESDSYMWVIDFGSGNSTLISGKLSPFFVENISIGINAGLTRRATFLKKLKKNKTYVPEAITKFGEK